MTTRFERRSRPERQQVLVVDDEEDIRELLGLTLLRMGIGSESAGTVAEAKHLLATKTFQLCLTDMRLPDGEGIELVRFIGENCRDLPVAVITAYGSAENAVAALKTGAFDYLSKPVSLDQLRALVRSALKVGDTANGEPDHPEAYQLLGESPAMQNVRGLISKLAKSQAPVYVSGESGSGKERAARLIHALSPRATQPFMPVNCGAIPENLMESEFFGYRKGAFTGAETYREGFFQAAHGGTLFLDEVADLPLQMQVKLLRVIQEKRVRKIGATGEDPVDVRIISATHQDLKALVEKGRFRQDLFYRLNVIELKMPSLRECREDIPLLAETILARMARDSGASPPRLSKAAIAGMQAYPFPGNVRELENVLERAMALLTGDEIGVDDLRLTPAAQEADSLAVVREGGPLQDYLDSVEKQAIQSALDKTHFNRTAAAKLLGVTFRSLRYRMERLGLKE
ncbi:MAG: sigma-54 dependent transcriptional regulator [Rhodocyclaceae bacterium]